MIRYINMKYGNILILFMLHSNLKSQKVKIYISMIIQYRNKRSHKG